MSGWNQYLFLFQVALSKAFNDQELEQLLRVFCDKDLEEISSKRNNRRQIIFDLLVDAVGEKWLDRLAAGTVIANPHNAALQTAVSLIQDKLEVIYQLTLPNAFRLAASPTPQLGTGVK